MNASGDADIEVSVIGAGCGRSPMPTRADAERAWRSTFAERLVALNILDPDAAQACAESMDVDLSADPCTAADTEVEYWNTD